MKAGWRVRDQSLAFQFGAIGALTLGILLLGDIVLDRTIIPKVAISGLLYLLVLILLQRLYYTIVRPLSALSDALRRYRGGDFKTRVPVTALSEIGYLQSSFNALAERIEGQVAELKNLDELKTEFISTVSHELRTPLTAISGYVRLIQNGDAGEVNSTQREFLEIVDKNVGRLASLIDDLLDVARIEAGKAKIDRELRDLRSILAECVATTQVIAKEKGLELTAAIPEREVPVLGDRQRLMQIFLNLLSNAIKYTRQGSIAISVNDSEYAVTVTIRDTGIGMSAEEQERLFEKFYRARSDLSAAEGGTGLGLVITRALVEAHGGTIRVESAPGEGSAFTVSLPKAGRSAIDERERKERADALRARRPVWVVGGSVDEREGVAGMLRSRIPNPVTTLELPGPVPESGEIAPVIVALLGTGELAGGRIATALAASPGGAPILAVGDAVQVRDAIRAGARTGVVRPLRGEALARRLEALIRQDRSRVLVVEPDTDLRLLLRRALESRGLEVEDVDRAEAALRRAEERQFELLLINDPSPGMPVIEFLRRMREIPQLGATPVFVMRMAATDDEEALPSDFAPGKIVAKSKGLAPIADAVAGQLESGTHLEDRP